MSTSDFWMQVNTWAELFEEKVQGDHDRGYTDEGWWDRIGNALGITGDDVYDYVVWSTMMIEG